MKKFLKTMKQLSKPTASVTFTATDSDAPSLQLHDHPKRRILLTRKEVNAVKRVVKHDPAALSPFSRSNNQSSQAYRIELVVAEFHTMAEVIADKSLEDCSAARIRCHLKFLDTKFKHMCRKETGEHGFRYVPII